MKRAVIPPGMDGLFERADVDPIVLADRASAAAWSTACRTWAVANGMPLHDQLGFIPNQTFKAWAEAGRPGLPVAYGGRP